MNLIPLISPHLLTKQREANGVSWLAYSLAVMNKKGRFLDENVLFSILSLPSHYPHGINYGQKCHATIGENGLPKCCNAH